MGSRSNSNTNKTEQFFDQREVNDAGGGVVGERNKQDNSIKVTDASRTSTSTTINTTDGGAFKLAESAQSKAIANASRVSDNAFKLANSSAARAFESSGEALNFGREVLSEVTDLARTVVGQAGTQASAAADIAGSAYAGAADTASGNKTLMYAGLAVVGLVAAVIAFRS